MPGCDVLPAQQEPDEVPGGDRLDLAPLPLPGVGVDPGQQPPGAVLLRPAVAGGEAAADGEAFLLQPGQRADIAASGSPVAWTRSATADGRGLQVAAEHVRGRRVRVSRRRPGQPGTVIGHHRSIREQGLIAGRRSTAHHTARPGRHAGRPGGRGDSSSNRAASLGGAERERGSSAGRAALGVARVGADLLGDPLDRGRVEPAQLMGFDRQAAAQRHRAAAAFLQRRVVEVGERPPVQDLVRQHRRLRGVPHDDA